MIELDHLVAAHAFRRAADAFADATAAARAHRLGEARKLAAEAVDHLATAERAQHGLGFSTYPPKTLGGAADDEEHTGPCSVEA